MVTALDPEREHVYILKCDRDLPEDQQTKWYYKILPYKKRIQIKNELVETVFSNKGGSHTRVRSGTEQYEVLLNSVTRVENLKDENGNIVEYPTGNNRDLKEKFWTRIPEEYCNELARVILGTSELGSEEEENLS